MSALFENSHTLPWVCSNASDTFNFSEENSEVFCNSIFSVIQSRPGLPPASVWQEASSTAARHVLAVVTPSLFPIPRCRPTEVKFLKNVLRTDYAIFSYNIEPTAKPWL